MKTWMAQNLLASFPHQLEELATGGLNVKTSFLDIVDSESPASIPPVVEVSEGAERVATMEILETLDDTFLVVAEHVVVVDS